MRETASDPKELDRRYAPKDNLHFTRQDLENGKSGEGNEWDVTFARLVNDILPFDNCVFHGGGEGWGLQGHSFADLQMRVFVGSWGPDAIPKLVQDRVFPAAQKMSRGGSMMGLPAGASLEHSTKGGWRVESVIFPMWFFDYGAVAMIDFYIKKLDQSTIVLIFMYTSFPRNQKAEMQEVVRSFRMIR